MRLVIQAEALIPKRLEPACNRQHEIRASERTPKALEPAKHRKTIFLVLKESAKLGSISKQWKGKTAGLNAKGVTIEVDGGRKEAHNGDGDHDEREAEDYAWCWDVGEGGECCEGRGEEVLEQYDSDDTELSGEYWSIEEVDWESWEIAGKQRLIDHRNEDRNYHSSKICVKK